MVSTENNEIFNGTKNLERAFEWFLHEIYRGKLESGRNLQYTTNTCCLTNNRSNEWGGGLMITSLGKFKNFKEYTTVLI